MIECQCFDCKGMGGYTDIVCDDGTGPFEPCGICNGTGELTIFKWIKFKILLWWYK
uniref:Uncharacterized protein n=1 Tax=viral metagenome TaxID=1070528 RepID=A0A6M3LJ19_9ZZZZ